MRKPDVERFEEKIEAVTESGCWIWTAYTAKNGYGKFGYRGKVVLAHRFSYEYYNGDIPEDKEVCHICDERGCVNPAHLFLGTRSDNMQDCKNKGRLVMPETAGEAHPMRKLTAKQVQQIKAEKGTQTEIAKKYGIAQCTVSEIKRGKSWKCLDS